MDQSRAIDDSRSFVNGVGSVERGGVGRGQSVPGCILGLDTPATLYRMASIYR